MIRDAATLAQVRAARPEQSSWVVANAGSGKTRVLTDRVARLLLRGADPQRILCLTYTKAAAGEMQNRLFARLGQWAMLPDADLRAALAALDEDRLGIPDADLARARTLFARALETPGGLRIQTIHAFCEALLRRFPLEAGVPPRFEVLEVRQAAQERAQILDNLARDPASGFDDLAQFLDGKDLGLDAILEDIARNRDRLNWAPDPTALHRVFGLDQPAPDLRSALDQTQMATLMEVLARFGGKNETRALAGLRAFHSGANDANAALRAGFLKKDGDPLYHNMGTKKVTEALPEAAEILAKLAETVAALEERKHAERALARTQALLRFSRHYLAAYDARKLALGVLEFDDMIRAADHLLTRSDMADWIRYRLDGGIHHVLVDEAQDTSPAQWRVIDALTAEFFAGASADPRTVFVVGDEKQSIFSFQGADPAALGAQQASYGQALEEVSDTLERCDLLHSFRSAPPILDLVDQVFADKPGITEPAQHRAFKEALPGRVDLWPWQHKDDAAPQTPWTDPVDHPGAGDAQILLAERLAHWVAQLIASGHELPGQGRAIGPGDFLILVRTRGAMFRAILSALKGRGVRVAGADRLRVNEQLIVRDLLGLLSAVATGADDLGLAAALRSPLCGLSEAELFALAQPRTGSLAEALLASEAHPKAQALYRDLRATADFLRPYEMLQRILVRHETAPAIRARLGPEAEEAVAALLDLALDYERVEPPTLMGFLDWMASGDPEVKRQLDAAAGEVRVMTVHGAKGLEAPIVILPQTGKVRDRGLDPVVPLGADLATLAVPREAGWPKALRQAAETKRALEAEERWRLLYVALTRAEQWLVVAGAGDDPGVAADSWFAAVADGMERLGALPDTQGVVSFGSGWSDRQLGGRDPAPVAPAVLPDWAQLRAPAPAARPATLAPSRDGAQFLPPTGSPIGPQSDGEAARLYGLGLHRLLEVLPGHEPAARLGLAHDVLAKTEAPTDQWTLIAADAERLLNDPNLAWVFGPGSLAEVAITGSVAALGGQVIRGQVDRLVFGPTEAWIIDYKSQASPPAATAPLSPAIAGQLALYVLALQQIHPELTLSAAVLWTRTGQLTPLPQETVAAVTQSARAH